MTTTPKPKPYDRQPSETDKSWAAFCVYRDMGRDRNAMKVAEKCNYKQPSLIQRWCLQHSWVLRCSAFDDEETQRESIALQELRLKRRLQMEKDAWTRRDRLIKKADTMMAIPIGKPTMNEDGTTIYMPTDKWSLKDAIAFFQYADTLGIFATGGETKKLDEVEAVTILADMGLLPAAAVVAISQGFQQFKSVIKEALLNENESNGERDQQDGEAEIAFSDILGESENISAPASERDQQV